MSEKNRLGYGCALLLALPFCAFGVGAAVLAVREWIGPGDQPEARYLLPVFALVFGGVGFGLLFGLIRARRRERRVEELREEHPAEPWRWNPDWAEGRVRCDSKAGALGLLTFAVLWMAISGPAAFFGLREELPKGNPAVLIALLFPLVGLVLTGWAAVAVARWRKYGVSVFEMHRFPGVVGGSVEGEVQVAAPVRPDRELRLVLSCLERRTRGSGKNRRTSERALWQDERSLPAEALSRSRASTTIPVAFRVPSTVSPTERFSSDHAILWRLAVSAETPGADYETRFEIPVFRTEESVEDPPEPPGAAAGEAEVPRDPRIHLRQAVGGRLHLTFSAFRNVGVAFGLGIATLACWAILVGLWQSDAPRLFPIVFGLFGVFLTLAFFGAAFRSTEVLADREGLSLRTTWFGLFGPTRRWTAAEIEGFGLSRGLQASGGRETVTYHDLDVRLSSGKSVTLGHALRSRREGEWLGRRLEEALGLG